jgi:hypothetical protein
MPDLTDDTADLTTWPSIAELRARATELHPDESEVLAAAEAFLSKCPPDQREEMTTVPLRARRLLDGTLDVFPARPLAVPADPAADGVYPDDDRPWAEDLHGHQATAQQELDAGP